MTPSITQRTHSALPILLSVAMVMISASSSSETGTSMRAVFFPSGSDRPDLDSIVSDMEGSYLDENFIWQCAAVFWASVCFFRMGAMTKGITVGKRQWFEICQAACIVVLLFGLVSEGRGCRFYGPAEIDAALCVSPANHSAGLCDVLGILAVQPVKYELRNVHARV